MQNPFNKLVTSPFDGPQVLSFNTTNSKLRGTRTAAFSLPAGYTCPGACDCLAWFDRDTNKLKDGHRSQFRCFAASMEAAFPSARKSVDKNLAILKTAGTAEAMAEVIDMSLPSKYFENIRVHADGDFFNKQYFIAWMTVAARNPERTFYAYTKSIPIWRSCSSVVPDNFILTASRGGKWDTLIDLHNLRNATVVMHPNEAKKRGLEIDHNDSLARDPDAGNFALLLHGQQPAGSDSSKALSRMRAEGINYSYPKKKGVKS